MQDVRKMRRTAAREREVHTMYSEFQFRARLSVDRRRFFQQMDTVKMFTAHRELRARTRFSRFNGTSLASR